MKFILTLTVLLFSVSLSLFAGGNNQTLVGKVVDSFTDAPLISATVTISNNDFTSGAYTNKDGVYRIDDLPIGRYNVKITYIGYEPIIINEVILNSSTPVELNIELNESSIEFEELEVSPTLTKSKPINSMASVSARMFTVEEASRYAGGFDDPARLATSFAGVSSGISNNSIIIRGNAPKYLLWQIEGIEVSAPNHFANLETFGGGGLTALSSNVMGNSDFFTSAFPSEYNNAISGVFDINMRKGNTTSYKHGVEIGAIGVDLMSEGPLSKSGNSSYIVNYRYSTLGLVAPLLPEDAQGTNYQDISFKLNINTENLGVFSIWGLGLLDNSGTTPNTDSVVYYQDLEEQKVKQYMGAFGLNNKYLFSNSVFLSTSLALTAQGTDLNTRRLIEDNLLPENGVEYRTFDYILNLNLNSKVSDVHSNKTGFSIRNMNYNIEIMNSDDSGFGVISAEDGSSSLISLFSSSMFNWNEFTLNLGLTSQVFTLNDSYTLEPRVGANYRIDKSTFSFGYGLHSSIEPLNLYFVKNNNSEFVNKNLGFTKAHHFVLGYESNINDKLSLKIEPYFQYLFDVPMVNNSTLSTINSEDTWYIDDNFDNNGIARNFGLDLTLEQYIVNGFYYLVSGSIFKSQYSDGENWYSTRFDKGYVLNLLTGYEFDLFGNSESLLSINIRYTYQGGERYHNIDMNESEAVNEVRYDFSQPFVNQHTPSSVVHFTSKYDWNTENFSHSIAIKVINMLGFEEFKGFRYNLNNKNIEKFEEALFIPNISYKLNF